MKVAEIIKEIFDIDKSLLKTFLSLFYKPAYVFNNKTEYTSPLKYSIIITSLSCGAIILVNKLAGSTTDFSWAVPKRIFNVIEDTNSFFWNFFPARLIVQLIPLFLITTSIFFKRILKSREFQVDIGLYLSTQTIAISNILVAISDLMPANMELDYNYSMAIEYILPIFYSLFALAKTFPSPRIPNIIRSIVTLTVVAFLYFNVTDPIFDYLYNIIAQGRNKLFRITSDLENAKHVNYSVDGDITAYSFNQDTISIFTNNHGRYESNTFVNELNVSSKTEQINVVKSFRINSNKVLVGKEKKDSVLILFNDRKVILKIRDSVRISSVDLVQVKPSIFVLAMSGSKSKANQHVGYLGTFWLENNSEGIRLTQFYDSITLRGNVSFKRIALSDSTLFLMTSYSNSDNQIIKLLVSGFSINNIKKPLWENTIYEKSSKYSPLHNLYLKIDIDKRSMYGFYSIPNDTNFNIGVSKINLASGKTDYLNLLKLPNDQLYLNGITQDNDDIFLVGQSFVLFEAYPFFSSSSLGAIIEIDKAKGVIKKQKHYGRISLSNTDNYFTEVAIDHDKLIILGVTYYYDFNLFARNRKYILTLNKNKL